ncbi:MAG: nicotinate-nucleotide adenylyltransferase [Vicinamibacterales bacterium]|nr:nicotinate-nucleotide adenylyltransferase [Vicinamibacterales bacterium]
MPMVSGNRLGILGGTLDPIHNGHLETAQAARRALALDRVLLLPAHTPPHRSSEPRASAFHRFAMAALAASTAGMEVSDLELRRDGPSYTSMTLECLHADGYAASQLYFILGADAFAEIETWYDYPRLLDLGNFVVVSRPGFATANLKSGPGILRVIADTPDVSSTEIRRRVGAGESIDEMVPGLVADHIHRHRLYAPAAVTAVL